MVKDCWYNPFNRNKSKQESSRGEGRRDFNQRINTSPRGQKRSNDHYGRDSHNHSYERNQKRRREENNKRDNSLNVVKEKEDAKKHLN